MIGYNFNNATAFGVVKIIPLKGEKGEKGEAGTSGDYSGLTHKPKINGIELDGNMTGSDLALVTEAVLSAFWETIYPVGAIYASANSTSPETLFGGTWVEIESWDNSINTWKRTV